MANLGKVDREFFDTTIYPNLGADRSDVRVEPQHGVDFGVIDVGDRVVVLATDPIFIMPVLGFERAAWFAVHILLSDVAVSGIRPTHLAVDFNLPPEITDEEFETVWETFDREARAFDVQVATGHTGRYAGCNYPMVGGGMSIAVGDPTDLVLPTGANPGDRVIITKGPAIETTGLLSIQFESILTDLGPETLEAAQDRFYDMSPVRDALVAAEAGAVTAMHDATEGGVYGGLHEVAANSGVRIDVNRDAIPVLDGVRETCDAFDVDPWAAISEGTLIATAPPDAATAVVSALEDADIPAADVGVVAEGSGVYFDGEPVEAPTRDPFWAAVERGMAALEEATE